MEGWVRGGGWDEEQASVEHRLCSVLLVGGLCMEAADMASALLMLLIRQAVKQSAGEKRDWVLGGPEACSSELFKPAGTSPASLRG